MSFLAGHPHTHIGSGHLRHLAASACAASRLANPTSTSTILPLTVAGRYGLGRLDRPDATAPVTSMALYGQARSHILHLMQRSASASTVAQLPWRDSAPTGQRHTQSEHPTQASVHTWITGARGRIFCLWRGLRNSRCITLPAHGWRRKPMQPACRI